MESRTDPLIIATQTPEWQATIALIDALLEAERKVRRIPGMSAAIVYDQKIPWSKGFGFADVERNVPATPQTIYRMASVTKTFTATMLMQLRDAGNLHLDEPLEKYLPVLKVKSPFADPSPITFRHVVAHLAGLPRDDAGERVHEENAVIYPSVDLFQARLEEIELVAPPLTKKQYSNLGFMLLGLALGHVAGQPYTQYVMEHILRPLGMKSSGFEPIEGWSAHLQAQLATPYKPQREDETVPPVAPLTVAGAMNPALGLFSSIEDMARFISLQFRDGPAQGAQILKGSTLREMHSPIFLDPGWNDATALSWAVERMQNHTTIGHSGGAYGFSTDILIVPSLKLGLALFMNTTEDASGINRSVLECLLPTVSRLLQRQQKAQTVSATRLPPIQPEWKAYEGRYTERGMRLPLEVRLEPDKLIATILGTDVILLPLEEHHFRMQESPLGDSMCFVRNSDGIVIQAKINGGLLLFVRE